MNATVGATPPYRFDGKTAIITEGGSEVGRETARQFARAGARVLIAGNRRDPLEQTVALIRNDGGEARHVDTNVSSAEGVRRVLAVVIATWGRLDILVNNATTMAGDDKPAQRLCDIDEAFLRQVLLANARGPWLAMKYAIPLMLKTGGGCVVNMSSSAGLAGMHGRLPYCASSHALLGLTKAAALEYAGKGIRINAICPSEVAAEAAAPILFLCSDAASNLHGMVLPVDGGLSAQ